MDRLHRHGGRDLKSDANMEDFTDPSRFPQVPPGSPSQCKLRSFDLHLISVYQLSFFLRLGGTTPGVLTKALKTLLDVEQVVRTLDATSL